MPTFPFRNLSALALLLLAVPTAFSDENDTQATGDASTPNQVVTIDGVFDSKKTHEITAGFEQISSLTIKRILDHGTPVKKGTSIVWFETKDIDEQITKAERDLELAEITLNDADFAYEQFLEQQKLDRQAAELARAEAQQAYDNFVNVDREQQIRSAEKQLERSKQSLEYAQEELNQLQQMYEEDDLTEESEEIVLKRAQRAVESAKFNLEIAEVRTQRTIAQTIPAKQKQEEATLARAELAYAKKKHDLKSARDKREIERRKQKADFEKQQAEFKKLQSERRAMVLTSPIEGLAYHGKITRGKMSDKPSTLQKDSKVSASQILMTIVQPQPLRIVATVTEEQRAQLQTGMKGTAIPKAFPDQKVPVTLRSIAAVPYATNKIECVVSIQGKTGDTDIVPGMTCKVELEPTKSDDNKKGKTKKDNKKAGKK
ncbi:HlyD family secretion protein [Rhodopirellula sallentina]|uniref:Efflux pump-like protein n=1 Tax=Rhodopirellula sallentina SM41 TaxID=1263870 RepID=M5TWR3_9BACT|nr:HlyD family secretion protein [Rhodopirellula sallentina]EMI53479.1 efflux pump-like protein [Rhodopirellula sallentina SM41]